MCPRFFHRSRRPPRAPRGFSLVETLVAIVLIEVGLLAMTASSAVVIREMMLVRARVTALEISRNRIETLAATHCTATSGSAVFSSVFRDDWSARVERATRTIRDSVTFALQRVKRAVVLETRMPCAP